MTRYYAAQKTFWVDPVSGTIVKESVHANHYYARDPLKPELTLVDYKITSNEDTVESQVNAARAKTRLCGRQRFAAARPLSWNASLGAAAQGHSKAMAYGNYFAHKDPDGDMPADRARAAGYRGRQIGENIAAGQGSPGKAMAGWLASPGHCANLMNPMFTQVGAAHHGRNGIHITSTTTDSKLAPGDSREISAYGKDGWRHYTVTVGKDGKATIDADEA